MKNTKSGLFVLLAVALLSSSVLAGDMILQKNGNWFPNPVAGGGEPTREDLERSNITIIDEDYDFIWYKFDNVATRQKLETAKVRRILHGSVPDKFTDGVNAMQSNDFETALGLFDDVAKGKRTYPSWARMYSLFNMGRIYQEGLQDWARAVEAWDRLAREFKKSKFLPKALVSQGLAYLNMGKEAEARRSFGQLQRLPGLAEGEKKTADYWLIKINQLKGEQSRNTALINQALTEYRRLLSEVEGNSDLTEVAILARLGIGDCLLLLEKHDDALAFFKKIAASSDDPDVLAGAFNGLGRCHFAREEWNDALFSFLRTVVLYNTNPEQTAMATYWAARSYVMRQGDEFRQRARELYRECMARYPGTRWARESEEWILRVPRGG
jgi:tetratricopeptide (TPR) repeat protein